jgi:hypothetical protein
MYATKRSGLAADGCHLGRPPTISTIEAIARAENLLWSKALDLHAAFSRGTQWVWQVEENGEVTVGRWELRGPVSLIKWYNKRGDSWTDVESNNIYDFLLQKRQRGILPDPPPLSSAPTFVETTKPHQERFLSLLRRHNIADCYVYSHTVDYIGRVGITNCAISNGLLIMTPTQEQRSDSTPNPTTYAAQTRALSELARSLNNELSAYNIAPSFLLLNSAYKELQMARIFAEAGWTVVVPQDYHRPGLKRFLTIGNDCRFRIVSPATEERLRAAYFDTARDQSCRLPPQPKLLHPAIRPILKVTQSPSRDEVIALSQLSEKLRRDPSDAGVFFHGLTEGDLSPRFFNQLSQKGSFFYLIKDGAEITAAAIVDSPALAHKERGAERLTPGKPSESSFIRWIIISPSASSLSGALYKRLIKEVTTHQASLGSKTLVGLLHPLSERGIRAHQALGKFELSADTVELNGVARLKMYRHIGQNEGGVTATKIQISPTISLSERDKATVLSFCRQRLEAHGAFTRLANVCHSTLRQGPRRDAIAGFVVQFTKSVGPISAHPIINRQIKALLAAPGSDNELTELAAAYRRAIPEHEALLRTTLVTLNEREPVSQDRLPTQVPSTVAGERVLIDDFKRSIDQPMTAVPNLANHFKRGLSGGNWWYSASAILFDLMASPTQGIADQAAIDLRTVHDNEQFLNFQDAIESDKGPVELATLFHYLNSMRAATVKLIASDLMSSALAEQVAHKLRSVLFLK